jgi:toxin ParE1/3/4
LVKGIIDATIALDKNPSIGQKEALLRGRHQEFRYIIYKDYKIIYWVDQPRQRLIIANVFDCRQNPGKMEETK